MRLYRGAKNAGSPKGAKVKTSVYKVELRPGMIIITFREHSGTGTERVYVYTNDSCGEEEVQTLKDLAKTGAGLNRYINARKPPYDQYPEDSWVSKTSAKATTSSTNPQNSSPGTRPAGTK